MGRTFQRLRTELRFRRRFYLSRQNRVPSGSRCLLCFQHRKRYAVGFPHRSAPY
ncbi:Uncharacterised protein [Vibrio cholerae]|nr:Uncharacterised protein [Vibrio cholerae]